MQHPSTRLCFSQDRFSCCNGLLHFDETTFGTVLHLPNTASGSDLTRHWSHLAHISPEHSLHFGFGTLMVTSLEAVNSYNLWITQQYYAFNPEVSRVCMSLISQFTPVTSALPPVTANCQTILFPVAERIDCFGIIKFWSCRLESKMERKTVRLWVNYHIILSNCCSGIIL